MLMLRRHGRDAEAESTAIGNLLVQSMGVGIIEDMVHSEKPAAQQAYEFERNQNRRHRAAGTPPNNYAK